MNPLDVNSELHHGYFGKVCNKLEQQNSKMSAGGTQSMSHWYTVATRRAAQVKEGSSDTAGSGAISERWAGCKSILWMEKDKAHAGLSLLVQIDRMRGKRGECCSLKYTLPACKRLSIHPPIHPPRHQRHATVQPWSHYKLQIYPTLIRFIVLAKTLVGLQIASELKVWLWIRLCELRRCLMIWWIDNVI